MLKFWSKSVNVRVNYDEGKSLRASSPIRCEQNAKIIPGIDFSTDATRISIPLKARKLHESHNFITLQHNM